jgi:hypothetical protein
MCHKRMTVGQTVHVEDGFVTGECARRASRCGLSPEKLVVCTENLSVLMTSQNHLSWRNDRAPVFRRGRLGLTIQVEDPA